MKKWLFNPFMYIAGTKSLFIGLAIMAATATIGFYSHTHFDGVVDMHNGRISALPFYFWEQLIDWGTVVVIFFITGKIFSKSSIRFIDVAGTMAMARWVAIFSAVIGFGINAPNVMPHSTDDILKVITPSFVLFGLLSLVFIIWMIALMYNAFRVSCNMKGSQATGLFILSLIIAEIISKLEIYILYSKTI